jgi:hypothetical protein
MLSASLMAPVGVASFFAQLSSAAGSLHVLAYVPVVEEDEDEVVLGDPRVVVDGHVRDVRLKREAVASFLQIWDTRGTCD